MLDVVQRAKFFPGSILFITKRIILHRILPVMVKQIEGSGDIHTIQISGFK